MICLFQVLIVENYAMEKVVVPALGGVYPARKMTLPIAKCQKGSHDVILNLTRLQLYDTLKAVHLNLRGGLLEPSSQYKRQDEVKAVRSPVAYFAREQFSQSSFSQC